MLFYILWEGITNVAKIYSYCFNFCLQSTEYLEKFFINLWVVNVKERFLIFSQNLFNDEFNGHIFSHLRNSTYFFPFLEFKILFGKCFNNETNLMDIVVISFIIWFLFIWHLCLILLTPFIFKEFLVVLNYLLEADTYVSILITTIKLVFCPPFQIKVHLIFSDFTINILI